MTKTLLDPKILDIFKKYPVVGAYFYGSKFQGKPSALSDLDIGILLGESVPQKNYFPLRLEIQDALGKRLKSQKVDLSILNETSPLLTQNVVTKGRLIFSTDKAKIVDFACQTLKKYDDACFLQKTYYQHLKTRAYKQKLGETKR